MAEQGNSQPKSVIPTRKDVEGNINMVDLTYTRAELTEKIRSIRNEIKRAEKDIFKALKELVELRKEVEKLLDSAQPNSMELTSLWAKMKLQMLSNAT
ncbi:hypothetical protein L226DRAFT_567228 [Lentinus tigrinus ALCF2SS1-7]|uniref:uncharacterized protein n=1 Tax=Lentinus tigrinus ALCF2SS1-7 TaxID=1328758 RepID=UPI001166358B|nr:hypothetical protein L226DRAFT_567228 [Lentinus tigrinus ALCF2SS1-7]